MKIIKKFDRICANWFVEIMNVDDTNIGIRMYFLFRLAAIFVIVVFLVDLLSIGRSNFGEWGDFFGGVLNPLLTFLMFMGLLITIALQQRELREARFQFERSADALSSQKNTNEKQAYETTFFNLVASLNDAANQLDLIKDDGKLTTGRDCFGPFYTRLSNIYKEKIEKHSSSHSDCVLLNWSFDLFLQKNEQNLSHYFRIISETFKKIEKAPGEHKVYADIVAAQLSNRELCLVFYYCAAGKDEIMSSIAGKYCMFSALPYEYLLDDRHVELVGENAFGEKFAMQKPVRVPIGIK
jgi:Putative phage abortive infection protein